MMLFVRIYSAFVGNMALIFKPEGGTDITGGMTAKIISWIKSGDFILAYLNKGRMRILHSKCPYTSLLMNELAHMAPYQKQLSCNRYRK